MVFCVFGLSGCWDRKEVKNLALVMATGIDEAPKGDVRLTVQTAVPSGVGGGSDSGSQSGLGKSFVLATAIGKNVRDTDQLLQEQLPRKLYTAHRLIILIGENEAKRGIGNVLDQFGRDPENRMRDLIIVAKGGTANDFLSMPTLIEKVPGQEIKTIEEQESGSVITMLDFLKAASSRGLVPVTPAIEMKGDPSRGEQPFTMTNTAVFKNLKLIGYLNNKETRGLMWLQGKIKHGYITADIPRAGKVTLQLTNANRKIESIIKHGHVQFNVVIKGKGEIVENDTQLHVDKKENFNLIKTALDDEVKSYIQNAYQRAQAYDTDVFGFGQAVYRSHPKTWQGIESNWDEMFKHAELNLSVDIEPLRTGMSGPSLHLNPDEVMKPS